MNFSSSFIDVHCLFCENSTLMAPILTRCPIRQSRRQFLRTLTVLVVHQCRSNWLKSIFLTGSRAPSGSAIFEFFVLLLENLRAFWNDAICNYLCKDLGYNTIRNTVLFFLQQREWSMSKSSSTTYKSVPRADRIQNLILRRCTSK